MRIAVHQPAFLPWVGFWHKLAYADVFVALNAVQYTSDAYLSRVRLNDGWLTLPVSVPDSRFLPDVVVPDPRGLQKIVRTIQQTVGAKRNPYRDRIDPVLEALDSFETPGSLVDLNVRLIGIVARVLGVTTNIVRHDERLDRTLSKTSALAEVICRHGGSDAVYLTGQGALDYLDPVALDERGVKLRVQQLAPGTPDGSILQLIATVEDPLAWVLASGEFA